ncbi:MAG: hypothetical protein IJ783_01950, partial [Kiritimatiellae bacterium]|nr:hypothetical protein [Kiritimatiellia bacterium]
MHSEKRFGIMLPAAAIALLASGCVTSRTSIFGTRGAGSPRASAERQAEMRAAARSAAQGRV